MNPSKKNVAFLGVFIALALIFSYVESLIPFFFGVPGMKLGLANSLVLILLYTQGTRESFIVNLIRIILSGFLFGNIISILYSLSGAVLSFVLMLILKRSQKFSIVSISVVGGITHNLGQLLVAMVILNSINLIYYFSLLMISGFITGLLMGIISLGVIKRILKAG